MVDAEIRRKIRARANMIARTETQAAACAGQQLHWEDQMAKGYLSNEYFQKEWIVTPDDRLCPVCAAMEGKRAPIDGTFDGGYKTPPLHPMCRCSFGLVEIEGKTLEDYAATAEGKDWTAIDQLAGIVPVPPTLPPKVKDTGKAKSKVPDAPKSTDLPKPKPKEPPKPKAPSLKKMTPDERIAFHGKAIDEMADADLTKLLNTYFKKYKYAPFYGLREVTIEQRRALAKQVIELQEKYPMKKPLNGFMIRDFGKDNSNTYAWYRPNSHWIELNLKYYKDPAYLQRSYANNVKNGFHPKGTKADSILTHEYGHAVHYDIKNTAERGSPMDMMTAMSEDQDITYIFKRRAANIEKDVSRYATKNEREFWAETFTQRHYTGRTTNEYTQFVDDVLKEYMGGM